MTVGERVPYKVAAAAQRQAHARAFAIDRVTLGDVKVLDAVLDETAAYSKLTDRVPTARIARRARVSIRTVRRSLAKLAEHGAVVYEPGLGRGNLTVVGVSPAGEKADVYLSALREADPAGFPPRKADADPSAFPPAPASAFPAGKGTPTRARVGREENLAGEGGVGRDAPGGPSGPSRSDPGTLVGGRTGADGDAARGGDGRLSDDEIVRHGTMPLGELARLYAAEAAAP
jgi:hypothetical protein